ncbi:MAG: universal stress protein [Acidobacteria bacterium]|nr:universal stress protein [Acidobacteriota bacterium]MDW7984732.1 universal stress protein [Acidobacteriota bacterium]
MTTYLVGWDRSTSAEKALLFTVEIARQRGGQVVLWYAVDVPKTYRLLTSHGRAIDPSIHQEMNRWLDQVKAHAESLLRSRAHTIKAPDLSVTVEVWTGDLYEGLMDAVQRYDADWIVLGRGQDPHRLGSFALKVLRSTLRPVAVVPETYEPVGLHVIVVPVDWTIPKSAALPLALDLATRYTAEVHLVHVIETYLRDVPVALEAAVEQMVRDSLDEWYRQQAVPTDRTVHQAFRRATDAGTGILAYATEVGADLIVMDSHARGPLMHLMLGSVAEKVLQRATVPVIVTKPEGGKA